MTATVARLHAGDGYTYLTRQVASADVTRERGQELSDYYTADGAPAGRWHGRGLATLGTAGTVSEAQMKALFGEGLHPDADRRITAALSEGMDVERAMRSVQLGRKFPTFDGSKQQQWDDALERAQVHVRAVHDVPEVSDLTREQRREARHNAGRVLFHGEQGRGPADVAELESFISKRARPTPQPVSGYDVTFTPAKSVSVLWGLGDEDTRREVEAAHAAAVDRAVAYIEDEAAFTRSGVAGIRQHEAAGIVAARFDHFDSRTGDPNLHTHVAIANRVQGPDGKWRTLDGRLIFAANVSYSEVYNTALEDEVSQRLGVTFEDREMGDGKRPVREIAGVDREVSGHFSRRRTDIEAAYRQLVRDYRSEHGHEPSKAAQLDLAQQANLITRSAKGPMESLASKRERWRSEAIEVVGSDAIDGILTSAQHRAVQARGHDLVDVTTGTFVGVEVASQSVLDRVATDRATWRRWHVHAETQRQLRGVPGLTTSDRQHLVEQVTDHAIGTGSLLCEAPDVETVAPELQRANGGHIYRVHGSEIYTSEKILTAERSLVDAAMRPALAPVAVASIDEAIEQASAQGVQLDTGQLDLVRAFAGADRQLVTGLGAAGTGKTRAMAVVVDAAHLDGHRVVGLAPSAVAAKVFAEETGADRSDTIAKVLHHLNNDGPTSTGINAGDLVVIDEAGMAGTLDLAQLVEHCEDRGARVRLLGDDQQLAAVAAGGALRTIAHEAGAVRLTALHRFGDPGEATATLQLRDGDQAALGFYEDAERIVEGSRDALLDDVFTAWESDSISGRTSLMIAGDNETVTELSERARDAAVQRGVVEADGIALRPGSLAGRGDVIVTRRNDRRLSVGRSDFVKNGDMWTVTDRLTDGSLVAQHTGHGGKVTLPADYTSRHVELGYATTVHRSQGMTVDVGRVLIESSMSREQLYVAMTRGRAENVAYTVTEQPMDLDADHRPEAHGSGREVLAAVMARTDESARSAHEVLRTSYEQAESLQRLVPEYEDALAIAHDVRISRALQDSGLDVDELREDPAYGALTRRLAARVEAGADIEADVCSAVDARELGSAESVAKVLAHRLDRMPANQTSTPRQSDVSPALTAWLQERRTRIEARQDHLVDQTRTDPPAWLRTLQIGGRRLDDNTLRLVVDYRDRHGVTDSARALGTEPERTGDRHEDWTRLQAEISDRSTRSEGDPQPETDTPLGASTLLERARRRPAPRPVDEEPPPPGHQPDRGHGFDR
ncbi:MobF family relaxase [Aeromicrobium sp. CF4.19]|uniref:MobF family relaxase n=1 Tax=Aeromicrobium sp. CF4.19 TaxID=3373082 RepID=UPI003EE5A15D